MHTHFRSISLTSALVLLASCGQMSSMTQAPPVQLSAAKSSSLSQCTVLTAQFAFANTRITAATEVAEGAVTVAGQPTAYAVGAHCVVRGQMFERKGADGRDYAIGFEMRLPRAWNGRYYYQANGGLDGNVQPALGALGGGPITGALAQGFAVISSDAGHTGAQTPYFGSEPQARLDYGYQAVEKLTPMAKALITAAYGRPADRSYIGGCSNGGRHAMVAMSRNPDAYDGYLVGAPGYQLPRAALAQVWGVQQWAPLMTQGATMNHPLNPSAKIPDLNTAFTAAERSFVAQKILQKCDALDGAADGMVQHTQACQKAFDVQRDVPTCGEGNRTGQCLSAKQKAALSAVHNGGQLAVGQAIYSPFTFDIGIAGVNWATWKFANAQALDPLAVSTVFGYPTAVLNPLTEDINQRFQIMQKTDAKYVHLAASYMTPPNHNNPQYLKTIAQRGGKTLIYHGESDAVFSAEDTRQFVLRAHNVLGGQAAADSSLRYYNVPGMNHCTAGPATDQFDALSALVKWVEQGQAPAIVANARANNTELPATWSKTRSRPLCAYPSYAQYKGAGDVESASSFECKMP